MTRRSLSAATSREAGPNDIRPRAPKQKPGKSKQDYGTPRDFLDAVERRFGALDVDLAARADNAKAPRFVTPEENSLSVSWAKRFGGWQAWLNPPFERIGPWAAKCAEEAPGFGRGRIFMLTPASIGAVWFEEHVRKNAFVIGLVGRLIFEGESDPYPKDCMLSIFGSGLVGFGTWPWRIT